MDIIALEIGNTSVQLAVRIAGETVLSMTFPAEVLERAPHLLLDALAPYPVADAWVSSVAPSKTASLESALAAQGYRCKEITRADLAPFLGVDVEEGVEVGIDLLLDCFALEQPGAIVVDLGTCNKLILKENGAFAGVAIAPGFAMGAKAIGLGTELVSVDAEMKLPRSEVGKNTPDALASGLLLLPAEGFLSLADRLDPGHRLPRFLTGGAAMRLAPLFPGFACVPSLALRGLLRLADLRK